MYDFTFLDSLVNGNDLHQHNLANAMLSELIEKLLLSASYCAYVAGHPECCFCLVKPSGNGYSGPHWACTRAPTSRLRLEVGQGSFSWSSSRQEEANGAFAEQVPEWAWLGLAGPEGKVLERSEPGPGKAQ